MRRVVECNCSICTKKGYVHWIVPRERLRVTRSEPALATYRFNTETARHHFCPVCGVAPFYVPRSDPDKLDVNVRCLEGIELRSLEPEPFDGRNWDEAERAYRAREES
jgi:hypothetical protein